MVIPIWIDMIVLIAAFMSSYEIFRKDTDRQYLTSPRMVHMAVCIVVMMVIPFINATEGFVSLAALIVALACLGVAIYFHMTKPPKLPTEPPPL